MSLCSLLTAALLLLLCPALAAAGWPSLDGRDPARQAELRAELAKIPQAHPRLFIREADLPDLRRRIADSPELRETYGWILSWAKGDQLYTNLWVTGYQLHAALLAYLLEGRDPALRDRCLNIMDNLASREVGDSNEHLKSWTSPIVARALAVGYDWLHPDLTPAQRERYGQKAIEIAKLQYNLGTWRHSDYNNHLYLEYGPGLYAGIALYKEGIDDPAAEQLALDGLELLLDHFIPAHNQVGAGDGGWHESMSYHAFFTHEFAHQLEAWSAISRKNLWADFPGLKGDAAWLVYNTRPFDGSKVGVADIHTPSGLGWQEAYYLPLLQRHYRDGLAGHLVEQIRSRAIADGVTPHHWWPYVLWYDPSLPAQKPETLHPARLFRGLGWASMRSDWTERAAFALFICGDYYAGHQHSDQNSFIIHKLAPLAIDAGEYGAKETRYHNTVLIGEGQRHYRGDPRRYYAPTPEGSEFDTGSILAYGSNGRFTYVAGNAANAHGKFENGRRVTRPVDLALRQFLFLRPDLFVVFDRIETAESDIPVTWLLHARNPADIREGLVTITEGDGRLFSRTLLPERAEITGEPQVGGRRNREDFLIRVPSPPGRKHRFLHVLYATERSAETMPRVERIDGDKQTGVRIVRDGQTSEVLFHTEGKPGGEVRILEDGRQIERRPLPTDTHEN